MFEENNKRVITSIAGVFYNAKNGLLFIMSKSLSGNLSNQKKPKLKCLGFTYNGAKLFNMLPIKMKKVEDPNTFKTMTKEWIWENIPSY